VNRSSVYREPPKEKSVSQEDLFLLRRIDELHTVHPSWDYRMITKVIRRDDKRLVNRKKIRRLMRVMGVYTIYPKPNLTIQRPNQVWGVDITYDVRMQKGNMYLFIIMDWYSRRIVDYELSSTLEKTFGMHGLKRALAVTTPEIINSDQGSHFTNQEDLTLMDHAGVKVSMDGEGQAFDSPRQLRQAVKRYMHEYNT
jgi:putative transposase